jgi:hypothetical protein
MKALSVGYLVNKVDKTLACVIGQCRRALSTLCCCGTAARNQIPYHEEAT